MEETFWDRTNRLIKKHGLTQDTLSTKCEFNDLRRVQNLSGTGRMPKVYEAVKIAQLLGVSVEYLVTGIPPKVISPEDFELAQKINNLQPHNKQEIMNYFNILSLLDEKEREKLSDLKENYSIPVPTPKKKDRIIRLKRGLE